jgi:outer membrane protein TolC
MQARLRAAVAMQRHTDARINAGIASTVSSSAAALDVARVRAELAQLALKLSLRKEFLEKGTSIEQLTQRMHTAQLEQEVAVLQQMISMARDRLAIVERQRSTGAVGEVELLRARLEVLETELSLQNLQEQVRAKR